MSSMPAHADALTFLPFLHVVADCIDASPDFMTRHTRILKPGPKTLFDEHIAVANAVITGARSESIRPQRRAG
jgi:hypothetical protein